MRLLTPFVLALAGASCCAAQDVPATPATPAEVKVPDAPGLYAVFDTTIGSFVTELFEDKAPLTVKNFIALAEGTKASANKAGAMVRKPYYNGLIFHRVIRGFMIQTGDVKGTGTGNCGIPNLRDELNASLKFDTPGRLAMANQGKPNTGACQIFITVGTPKLEGDFTIFGQVVAGMETVTAISKVPVFNDRPLKPVVVNSVKIQRQK